MASEPVAGGVVTVKGSFAANKLLYRKILAARVRSDWQYRTPFLLLLVSQALIVTLDLLALIIVLTLVPDLAGWTGAEVAFLYALATLPFAIADVFVSAVERVSKHIREGTMDRILLRPVPALLQISALEFELRRAGKVIPAVVVLAWAIPRVEVEWGVTQVVVLGLALVWGTMIYSALWIAAAAISFWTVASQEALNAVTYGGQFANQYPVHLYRPWIRAILGWGIPLAFVSYVPSVYLLGAANPLGVPSWVVFVSGPVALAVLACSMGLWRLGIRHYQSTGS